MINEDKNNKIASKLISENVATKPATKSFKILSIDGGGLKGLYAAKLLAEIENKTGTLIGEYFDMICGTSTGGLLALGITRGIPCKEIARFYVEHGPLIFPYGNWFVRSKRKISQICISTKFSNTKLKAALKELLGDYQTMEQANNFLCIPSFNITKGRPQVFKKPFGHYHRDGRITMMDVALATSAAPTFLPAVSIEGDQFIDGGIFNNNPSLIGYTEAMDHFIGTNKINVPANVIYEDICMLSVGLPNESIGEKPFISTNRSFMRWREKLVGTAMTGTDYIIGYQTKKLIEIGNGYYYRIDPPQLSSNQMKNLDMDNSSQKAIQTLLTYGQDIGDHFTSSQWHSISTFFNEKKSFNFT
jgi:predicted acylesterase/phospholipase RssA